MKKRRAEPDIIIDFPDALWQKIKREAQGIDELTGERKRIRQTLRFGFTPAANTQGGTLQLNLGSAQNQGLNIRLKSLWHHGQFTDVTGGFPDERCNTYMFVQAVIMTSETVTPSSGTTGIGTQISTTDELGQWFNVADDVLLNPGSTGFVQMTITGNKRTNGTLYPVAYQFQFYVNMVLEFFA